MQALRNASRLVKPSGAQQVRNMSAHGTPEENKRWMLIWTYTTWAATPGLIAFGYYLMSHSHDHHDHPDYPYMKKRDKPFPWGTECDLFDMYCAQRRAAAAAAAQ